MAYIVRDGMRFEWDPEKDERNRAKHGLSFQEASGLLSGDGNVLEFYDEAHSFDEDRFIAIGEIRVGVIVVVYTERRDEVIRILSARMATRRERAQFERYRSGTHE